MTETVYRKPFPGLVAFTIAFLSQWLGHTSWAFIRGVFGDYQEAASLVIGGVGAGLIWAGLKRGELAATWLGFLGALLIWVGWFEFTFEFYGNLFSIPAYASPSGLPIMPGATVLMATLPIMLALFLLYGLYNRQTKCNLIRWFHRNLRFDPGTPTPDNGRSFARVTALETLFVTWACYEFWLYVGYMFNNTVIMVAYAGWTSWAAYIFWKLTRIPRVAHSVRYGIPVGVVAWGVAEMPAHFGLYSEIWLRPFEYPVTNSVLLMVFIAGMLYVARQPLKTPLASGVVNSP
ncbi:MAG: hypothetical protein ABIX37_06080 [Gammaproteobacteria bacterium]